jgi:hypothetical protein
LLVYYLLSANFDYAQLIAGDGGPSFADDYGWRTRTLGGLQDMQCEIAIVDHRFCPEEISNLRACIDRGSTIFVFRVVDPFWEYAREHWWYRFVGDILDHPRCHVMLSYQPAEITALFATRARRSQFIFAPYVYRPERERPIDHEKRSRAMLCSGNVHATIYPLRSRMRREAYFWPLLGASSRTLPHPGYPDVTGKQLRHRIIGDAYVTQLAAFRFAAVCSSRCRLEFLKYRELAYAGVVPVGDMPATLLDCPVDAWVPWRRNFVALAHQIRTMPDTAARAHNFRRFMGVRRNVDDMRAWVAEQLGRL